jgi:ubiquinone/menaquinone biosynthesis C-methylase UbiE
VINVKKSWDKIAVLYKNRYDISREMVHYGPLCPGEDRLNLIGDIRGKKVIDLGCGGGQNAVALNKMGAEVTGVDFSYEQITLARKLADDSGSSIMFESADISSLPFIDDCSRDLAISACVISFVENIDSFFAETFRILKSRGRFILSDMNPLQYVLDETEDGMTFNNPYFQKTLPINWSWEFEELPRAPRFRHYVRPVTQYHNSLVDAGFVTKRILEPEPTLDTPHRGFSEEIMREYSYIASHIPITFIIVCEKP